MLVDVVSRVVPVDVLRRMIFVSGTAALVPSLMWPETTPAVCPNALVANIKVDAMNNVDKTEDFRLVNVFLNGPMALPKMFTFHTPGNSGLKSRKYTADQGAIVKILLHKAH